MNFFNNIVNELDIALRTLSDKKTGTEKAYRHNKITNKKKDFKKYESWKP